MKNQKYLIPVFMLMALVFGACGINLNINIEHGSGHVITQSRQVSNFDHVVLSGIGDVTITQGSPESLVIEAEDNVVPHITTEVTNGTLHIGYDTKTLIPTKPIKFDLTMPNIHVLETQGVSNIQAQKIVTDNLDIGISGTGNININYLTANNLSVNISGAGNFSAQGEVGDQQISMSGAGNYDGGDLKSKTADVTIAGLGRVVAWVTDRLDVTISGTGGVDYYGNPQVSQQISGLGRIQDLGSK